MAAVVVVVVGDSWKTRFGACLKGLVAWFWWVLCLALHEMLAKWQLAGDNTRRETFGIRRVEVVVAVHDVLEAKTRFGCCPSPLVARHSRDPSGRWNEMLVKWLLIGLSIRRERRAILREAVVVTAVDWFSNAETRFGACHEWLMVRLYQLLVCN